MSKVIWTVIDRIITAPAWMVGYTVRAYSMAYKRGVESYNENARRNRIGEWIMKKFIVDFFECGLGGGMLVFLFFVMMVVWG